MAAFSKNLIAALALLAVAQIGLATLALGVDKRVYETRRIEGPALKLDGKLDDPAWDTVEWAGDFLQWQPEEGEPPTRPTQFKILYDDHALYVGYRAFDDPAKIYSQVARRDWFPGDWVEINIDSYFDQRTAFSFTVSVSGVKGDEFVSEDGENWDGNWDPIWFNETNIDDQGWTAEVKIPLSQLRFGDKEEHVWGIQVTRRIFREEERSCWQLIPRDAPGWVSQFGELRGLRGLRPQRQVEVLPYVLSKAERFERDGNNPFATGSDEAFTLGLDGKIGVTSDLTVDLTINPDFGQVEADPSEVNLSAFETFFSERRPFFIEGNNIFNFQLAPAVTGGSFTSDRLFYSRRIGRQPHGYPDTENGEYAEIPDNTSIIGAAKLSGKTKNGISIGILESVTAKENANLDLAGKRRKETVEPTTNYFVGRAQKDYNQGKTVVGGMVTAVNRDIDSSSLDFLHTAAYAGAFDFRHTWKEREYYVEGNLGASHVRGDETAILDTQTASARYYQRPDASHVEVDSTRTSLSGTTGSVRLGKSSGGRTRFQSGVAWRSPGFETNDLGFLRRADEINQFTWAAYQFNNSFSIFRRLAFNANQWSNYDFGGTNTSNMANVNFNANFKNNYSIGAGVTRSFEYISNSELRGGPSSKWPGDVSLNFWFNSDFRKDLTYGFGGNVVWWDDEFGRQRHGWFEIGYRPTNSMRIEVNPWYTHFEPEMQYVFRESFESEDRYIFADMNQKTASFTFRVDYALTPNLSIQYYGEPFVSAGEYSAFKRITDSKADKYRDRFEVFDEDAISYDSDADEYSVDEDRSGSDDYALSNPDFNYKEFNSNLVIRWEFSPGSLAYLVWSQGRVGVTGTGEFSFDDDVGDLFDIHPHNILLIKISRWISL